VTATPSKSLPIYKKICSDIADQIRRGKLVPGEQLPSERELGLRRRISRMTARQVYQRLEEDGLVSRTDRQGWFVADARLQFSLTRSVSFIHNLAAQGVKAKAEFLQAGRMPAPQAVKKDLQLRKGQEVQAITRLLTIRGEPALVETMYFLPEKFPGILDLPLSGSILPVWRDTYNVTVHRGENTISGGFLSDGDAKVLKVRKGSPGIFLAQTMFDQNGKPFAHARQHWRNDIAEFFITVKFD
jgi:GntR family transcriptional regulator